MTVPGQPAAARADFPGIQALRAAAALAVAFLHVADEAGALRSAPGLPPGWVHALPLEAGVDLFFVISGFVMVWASWDAFGRPRAVGPFAWRRLLRIVPLYWVLSAATVAVAVLLPGRISDGLRDGWGYVAASFAFLPWRRADGFVQPVLRLGWTLNYEMLFYALVACALPLPRRLALPALVAALAALVAAGQSGAVAATAPAFWTDPIVAEFALGIAVAVAARHGWRAGWVGWAALVAALCLAGWAPDGVPRPLLRGVPSALLVWCALSATAVPRPVLLLGDASYALYLVHPFPMRAASVAFRAARVGSVPLYLLVTMAACCALAVLLHLALERPVLRWGRRLARP